MTTKFDLDGDVAIVTLNRPDRFNAIDAGLSASLVADLARAGDEARAVVLTGEGKAFCSGADLSGFVDEYDDGGPDLGRHLDDEFHPMVRAIAGCAVPVVAAVNAAYLNDAALWDQHSKRVRSQLATIRRLQSGLDGALLAGRIGVAPFTGYAALQGLSGRHAAVGQCHLHGEGGTHVMG